ncbi:inositol monophosphatase family protein [Geotoga petraea]|jgi:myo-inositol-1(or 4)-monophosphatase|uniref:Inositol monophosphatase n=1 Tax=Geotoga petraea TaxID=28234 RepID=A0A4Z0W2G4_9BACT|nr:inositol monophosphatase [Geotoga petraea]MDK2945287.1 monophosphatase [Geotoga sp.]TGG89233.1 inositol monophosphatase [Geotoga petraea]
MFEKVEKIVENAGEILINNLKGNYNTYSKKDKHDIVTEIDMKIQDYLKNELMKLTPNAGFLAEERGNTDKPKENNYWVIDPIDGTVNFSRGFPENCISVSYVENDEPVFGLIDSPQMSIKFLSIKGKGLFINGEKQTPRWSKTLGDSMITIGANKKEMANFINILSDKVMRIRLIGSAAIMGAYVASGYADAFIFSKSNSWDIAAAYSMIKEVGGEVYNFDGEDADIFSKRIIFSSKYIKDDLIKLIKKLEE